MYIVYARLVRHSFFPELCLMQHILKLAYVDLRETAGQITFQMTSAYRAIYSNYVWWAHKTWYQGKGYTWHNFSQELLPEVQTSAIKLCSRNCRNQRQSGPSCISMTVQLWCITTLHYLGCRVDVGQLGDVGCTSRLRLTRKLEKFRQQCPVSASD